MPTTAPVAAPELVPEPAPDPALAMQRADLVERYSAMVRRVVRDVGHRVPTSVDRNALFSAGIVGLLDASDKYEDARSVAFEAYARIRVRGAILDELRGLDHLTRTQRQRSRAVAECRRALECDGPVSDSSVAEQLGMTVEEVQVSRQQHVPPDVVDPQTMEGKAVRTMWADHASVEDSIAHQERIALVSRALANLPERNRLVVGLYYESEITLQEIGELLGVTQSRVSQVLKKTIALVRDELAPQL